MSEAAGVALRAKLWRQLDPSPPLQESSALRASGAPMSVGESTCVEIRLRTSRTKERRAILPGQMSDERCRDGASGGELRRMAPPLQTSGPCESCTTHQKKLFRELLFLCPILTRLREPAHTLIATLLRSFAFGGGLGSRGRDRFVFRAAPAMSEEGACRDK